MNAVRNLKDFIFLCSKVTIFFCKIYKERYNNVHFKNRFCCFRYFWILTRKYFRKSNSFFLQMLFISWYNKKNKICKVKIFQHYRFCNFFEHLLSLSKTFHYVVLRNTNTDSSLFDQQFLFIYRTRNYVCCHWPSLSFLLYKELSKSWYIWMLTLKISKLQTRGVKYAFVFTKSNGIWRTSSYFTLVGLSHGR